MMRIVSCHITMVMFSRRKSFTPYILGCSTGRNEDTSVLLLEKEESGYLLFLRTMGWKIDYVQVSTAGNQIHVGCRA